MITPQSAEEADSSPCQGSGIRTKRVIHTKAGTFNAFASEAYQ